MIVDDYYYILKSKIFMCSETEFLLSVLIVYAFAFTIKIKLIQCFYNHRFLFKTCWKNRSNYCVPNSGCRPNTIVLTFVSVFLFL